MKRFLIIGGVLGWVGGMGTMLLSGSCDVECLPDEDRPAVVVSLRPVAGAEWNPLEHAARVTFQVHSPREPGMKWNEPGAEPPSDLREPVTEQAGECFDMDCTTWKLGLDRPGRYEIKAELCGETFTGWADVEVGEDGCHVDTEFVGLEVDPKACEKGGTVPVPDMKDRCGMAIPHPSVYVYVAQLFDDYYQAVPVDRVWFEHDGNVRDAFCLEGPGGKCSTFIAGKELGGEITLHAEYCDHEFTETVFVERSPDGCHVQTEYTILEVDTRNCLKDPSQPTPPKPEPPTPTDGPTQLHG